MNSLTRAAASSIASGSPSRRTQISAITGAFALVSVLAYSAGLASGIYGRSTAPLALTTHGLPTTAMVAPQPQAQRYLLGGYGELVAEASNAQAAPTSRLPHRR